MPKISYADLHKKMQDPSNIINISVIAHVDHGKTTVTDTLVCDNGIIAEKNAGTARYTDTRKDEQERCITIKATCISLLHEHHTIDISGDEPVAKHKSVLINLIDSPGHMDFTAEVTASLRVTDAAMIVVDCTKGVQAQTITVGKQAVLEKIKPVLFINKFDTLFSTLALNPNDTESMEQAYEVMSGIINSINDIIHNNLKNPNEHYNNESVYLDMVKGNVAFGSGKCQWGLTLESAFNFYKRKMIPKIGDPIKKHRDFAEYKKKMLPKFWGENFVDVNDSKKWKKSMPKAGEGYVRGFCALVLKVILQVREMCENKDYDKLKDLIDDKNFLFPADPKELENKVLKKLFPLANVINTMITDHLPSPKQAAIYRADDLSTDPDKQGATTKAIRECDPSGPFMAFCSKKVAFGDLARPSVFTVMRILSGTMNSDMKLLYMDDKYEHGVSEIRQDMIGKFNGIFIMIGKLTEAVKTMPCGNVCGAKGIDKYLPGSGTIVEYNPTEPNLFAPIKNMKYTCYPIVGVRIAPQNNSDISKLIDASRLMQKLDLTCRVIYDEGGVLVFGNGPLHTEILTQDLKEIFGKPTVETEQIVRLAETVSMPDPGQALKKSANMHNRIFGKAYALDPEFTDYIDDVTNPDGFEIASLKNSEHELTDGLDVTKLTSDNMKRILHVGDGIVLYNKTQGFQHMDEMKSFIVDGLKKGYPNGPLAEETVRGVQYSIDNIHCHPDAIHRGQNQITPAMRAWTLGALLKAGPTLAEPMYRITIEGPAKHSQQVQSEMNKLKAIMQSHDQTEDSTILTYELSMYKSRKIQPIIMTATSGTWSTMLEFNGYEVIPGTPFDLETECGKRCAEKRAEKNLKPEIDGQSMYLDTL